jgi:Zn finger protein HypA/HybF involved in hydrogenase expression
VRQAVRLSFSDPLPIDFDEPNVVASYKRREKEEKQMQAYCVKCRAKKEMKTPKSITMKNGKPATQGVCPTCGTKMFRIGNA